jgi:hypothetical protein
MKALLAALIIASAVNFTGTITVDTGMKVNDAGDGVVLTENGQEWTDAAHNYIAYPETANMNSEIITICINGEEDDVLYRIDIQNGKVIDAR